MPVSKTRKINRKKRNIQMVSFVLESFSDDPFEVPSFNNMPLKRVKQLNSAAAGEEFEIIPAFLEEAGCREEAEAFEELDLGQLTEFMEAWQQASGIDLPKSQD